MDKECEARPIGSTRATVSAMSSAEAVAQRQLEADNARDHETFVAELAANGRPAVR